MEYIKSQTRGPGRGTYQKIVSDDSLINLFSTFDPLPHGPNITRLNKIYIRRKSYLSEGNFSPSWINNLGNLLLENMADSKGCYTIITNNISYNTIPNMMVTFLLVPIHQKEKFQEKERKMEQTTTKKL